MRDKKELETKLMKGTLDLTILHLLDTEPTHGYKIITEIRKKWGKYFGPSTIYPLLNALEKKRYIESEWELNKETNRHIKKYSLTNGGRRLSQFGDEIAKLIYSNLIGNDIITDPMVIVRDWRWKRRAALRTDFAYLPRETQIAETS